MSLKIKSLPPIVIPNYRDSVFVDSFYHDVNNGRVIIDGTFNSSFLHEKSHASLSEEGEEEFRPFHLIFQDIFYFNCTTIEQKKYEEADCSFFEVLESELITAMPESRKKDLRHFVLFSYDFIYEVVSRTYEFGLDNDLLIPIPIGM